MNFNDDDFYWVSLGGGYEGNCIKCFQNTSLRDTCYIKVETVDQIIKFDKMNIGPNMYYFKKGRDGGETFELMDDKHLIPLKQLIIDCEEVRRYVNEVAPEYTA